MAAPAPAPAPPPAPAAEHHVNPPSKLTVITYSCPDAAGGGQQRRVELLDGVDRRPQVRVFLGGKRPNASATGEIDGAVSRFSSIFGVTPQCGRFDDILIIHGYVGAKRHLAQVRWTIAEAAVDAFFEVSGSAARP
jgi:hypothetical protein